MPETSPITSVLKDNIPSLSSYEDLYKHFHRNPEISTLEVETSKRIAEELKSLSDKHDSPIEIKTGIGKTGLVGIHRNGSGPTVLLRADFDGIPVLERTGLDYASTKRMMDTHHDNVEKPVMHACGHDFHITSLLAAAETLLNAKDKWSGTIIYLFQPAEERGCGARMMLDDGLYDPNKHNCPKPDVCLGQHVFPFKSGTVLSKIGPTMSAADSFKITIHGRGGHGSQPQNCIDPVVIGSQIVLSLQTLVSRVVPPDEPAVITIGSFNAGDTVNVISDKAELQVNVRSVTTQWRKVILDGIKRIVEKECEAGRCPKPPEFAPLHNFPLTVNEEQVTSKVRANFNAHFGEDRHLDMKAVLGSEDFSLLGSEIDVPCMFWFFGGTDPEEYRRREEEGTLGELPSNHSPYFAPAIQPTLKTGVEAMVVAALTFVGKKE